MASVSNHLMFMLECDHVMPGNPHERGLIACFHCHSMKRITGVHVFEWRALCGTKGCTFAKWTGLSETLANQEANQHARRKPTHRVFIEYTRNQRAVAAQRVFQL